MQSWRRAWLALAATLLLQQAPAAELAPLEAYGKLPLISNMALSPSGKRIAYRQTDGEKDYVLVLDLASGKLVGGADVAEVKPRYLYFTDDETVLLVVSETRREAYRRQAYENSSAFVLDVATNEVRQLLRNASNIYPAQTGLGRVVGLAGDRSRLYMPAFTGSVYPRLSLFEVGVRRRAEKSIALGAPDTIDWLIDGNGRPLIEEQFDDDNNVYRIWAHGGKKRRMLYEEETDIPQVGIVGLTGNRDAVVISSIGEGEEFASHYHISIADGSVSGPYFDRDDASIGATLTDLNRRVLGVRYSGFLPGYEFEDAALTARIRAVQEQLAGTSALLVDWTPDFGTLLFLISGGWSSGDYVIVDDEGSEPRRVARSRPDIPAELVVPTAIFSYAARDGVTIPALLTVGEQQAAAGKVPLIVMPHGGPESYDRFGFDWKAQYFASRGYAVLQPQFRGSSGFGASFVELGKGEWGGRMSTDLDDGVRYLVEQGIVDPDRVCIAGASYGGYAALAAGAFSDFEYKCIVSISGVSDLPQMLKWSRRRYGGKDWVIDYWRDQFGSEEEEREALDAISPRRNAEAFHAPVLLVHGRKDTVVPEEQSEAMYRALRKAGKDVTLVRLDGEDHFLSVGETREQALRAVAQFIEEHL
jgi:dipeptidyl aminopeptidase/acylaminoacyl peptidase